jgi:hypothetical protein
MRDQHLLEARLGRAPVQAEGAVALRQGRGGEGAEQVGGVHGGLFWVVLKQCGFNRLVGLSGSFVLGLGSRHFLIGFIFRFTWNIFSVNAFVLACGGYAINGDGG